MVNQKKELRRESKNRISAYSEDCLAKKNNIVVKNLLSLVRLFSREKFIGVYAPLKNEVDWTIEKLEPATSFPGFQNGQMDFYKCSFEELETSQEFGVSIKCPNLNMEIVVPDFLLIPGLGFDLFGNRLGRGKGFYDRFLENYDGIKIGICFEDQIFMQIPTEKHDVKVDYVVSEKGVWKVDEQKNINI